MKMIIGKNMSMPYEFDDLTIDFPIARVQMEGNLVEYNRRLMVKLATEPINAKLRAGGN